MSVVVLGWGRFALRLLYRREEDIQKMLAAQVHIGTRNSDSHMQDYIWRRRQVRYYYKILPYRRTYGTIVRVIFYDTIPYHHAVLYPCDTSYHTPHS